MSPLQQLVPAATFVILLALFVVSECMSTGKNGDSLTDSSVTSYSTVVIHHPQGKKSNKDSDEGQPKYFKVKKLKASSEQPKIQGDFKPSQYLPKSEVEDLFVPMDNAQVSQRSRQMEFREGNTKQDSEIRKIKYKDEDRSSEESNWRYNFRPGVKHQSRKQQSIDNSQGHESRKESKQNGEESKEHIEVVRHHQKTKNEAKSRLKPKQEGKLAVPQEIPTNFRYEFANAIPAFPIDLTHPFETVHIQEQKLHPFPPAGMSPELIQTLLSQQPQTFDNEKNIEPMKKSKSQNFRVGYSIGFGGDEVVIGKPKDVRLHINGRNSVWKTLTNGIEMSEELEKKKPMGLKMEDSAVKSSDSVMKNDIYYMNNYKLDTTVPTAGRSSFDHAQALTNSNAFDFSNAVDPGWLQQQPVELDMTGLYQSLGYPSPLPVYIPGPKGSGSMVHAIVIPLQSLPGMGWSPDSQPLHATLAQHQPFHIQSTSHQPLQLQPVSHQSMQLQPVPHQSTQLQTANHQPFQLQATSHQPIQLQSAAHQPFHLLPLQYAQVIPMPQQHQPLLQSISMPVQLKAQVQQIQPTLQHQQKSRTSKVRDSQKQSTYDSTPIVVAPAPSDQSKLQQELNAILADEMKRKNQRHPAAGLRPPLPFS